MRSSEVDEGVPLLADHKGSGGSRCCGCLPALVEPVAVLYLLANGAMTILHTQFLYDKVSQHSFPNASFLNRSKSACSVHADNKDAGTEMVEKLTAQWTTYLLVAKLVPMVMAALFYGSLSDRLGRKICLVLPALGSIVRIGVDMAIDYFHLPLEFFFLEVLEYFFGGPFVFSLGCSAFIADTVAIDRRSVRMTILDALSFSSLAVSVLLVGYLKSDAGFLWSFVSVLAGNSLALIYGLMFIPTRSVASGSPTLHLTTESGDDDATQSGLGTSSVWRHLVSAILVYTKDGDSGRRWKLNVLLFAYFISAFSGIGHVITLYELSPPLCWEATTISLFNFEDVIVKTIVMVAIVCFLTRWLQDDWLALSGRLSSFVEHIYLAFCVSTGMMFAAPLIGCLNLLTEPMTKTLLTSLVQPEEQGSVLAVFSLAPILSMASGMMMLPIYDMTLTFMQGRIVFLLSGSLHLISFIMLGAYIWRRYKENSVVIHSEGRSPRSSC